MEVVHVRCRVFNFFGGNINSLHMVWIKNTVSIEYHTYKYFVSTSLTLSIFFNFPFKEILS